jgi:hypothetical protein
MRETSILEPSGEGKGERSRTVIFEAEKDARRVRESAVLRPKTPEPIMRIDPGAEGGIVHLGVEIEERRGEERREERRKEGTLR